MRNNRSDDRANFAVLEGFLSELLFDTIRIERIVESESNQDRDDDKFNRVDILTQNANNELIIIEIQNTYEIDYFQRMNYGAAKAISENLTLGQPYSDVKKVISIKIVYFDLGQGKDYIYKGGVQFEGIHKKDILQLSPKQKSEFQKKRVADIFPEYYLIKVNKFDDEAKDKMKFVKNLLTETDFPLDKIAGVSVDFVKSVQWQLTGK